MKFKAKENVNVKHEGDFLVLKSGDIAELPEQFVNHPSLEVVEEKSVEKKPTVVKKKTTKKTTKKVSKK